MSRLKIDIPLAAIIVLVVGLLLSGAAALLSTDEYSGGVYLEWMEANSIPDSAGSGPAGLSAKIVGAEIHSTRSNASGYRLFRVSAGLRVETPRRDDRATASCTVSVPPGTILGRTPGKRASYPLPSEDLVTQGVPLTSTVRFAAKGTDIVVLPLDDSMRRFTSAPGVKVDWAPYHPGAQTWDWVLTDVHRPASEVRLDFATLWRTTARPGADISCRVLDRGASAEAKTSGRL